ncbi:SDR family oxidoreductase [Anaerolineales bacterium HSG25]|nr:SDR family oxidoreductase [Anaerolineales bacterium HSG25]
MQKSTILIIGGSGYLGQYLLPQAIKKFAVTSTYHHTPFTADMVNSHQLDVTDRPAVFALVTSLCPTAIIHTAAVNPGGPNEMMMPVNRDGTRHIAEAAKQIGARLVHVSSDTVHNGREAPYADADIPDPLNLYGQSKVAGEQAIQAVYPSAVIVRTSLIYGLTEMDRGTAGFIKRLEAGENLMLFSDVLRQPVWAETLSEALLKLAQNDVAGILNIAGRQVLTRSEFGTRMLRWWNMSHHENNINTGLATSVSNKIPLDLRLSIEQAEQLLQMEFVGVDTVLNNPKI